GVARHSALRCHDERIERFFIPNNVRILHGLAVAELRECARVSPYDSRQAGSNAVGFVLRVADRTLGKFLLALGGITRTMAGHSRERDRNSGYGQRKQTSHVNIAISLMHHPKRTARPHALPANRKGLICGREQTVLLTESESRQALRAVVRNFYAGDLVERTVRLSGIPNQLRGIAVNLVEIGAIRRNPAVARSAGDIPAERPGGAVSRNLRACGITGDFQASAVDLEAGNVAVTEVRSVQHPVIR